MKITKQTRRFRRSHRVRARINGTASRPRLSVSRTLRHHYAQLVDDENGKVLGGVADDKIVKKGMTKVDAAKLVGAEIAKIAKEKGVTEVVFDRGSYKYHGRVKAIADGAREGGLSF